MSDSKRENYFAFLDALRESGRINMFGAAPFLRKGLIRDCSVSAISSKEG